MSRESYRHWTPQVVRWGDMDTLGHVNNAVYLTFCESARMSFFETIELERLQEHPRQGPAVVNVTCNFKRQVRYPATLEVGLRVGRVGTKSFTLEYGLFLKGEPEPVADGSSVVVWVDYDAERALVLPEVLRAALEPYGVGAE